MAEDVDKDSKTEEATEKKIRDTVEKGQLPHSRETAILASFVAILLFVVFFAGNSIVELGTFLSMFLEKPDAWPMDTANDVVALSRIVTLEIGKAVASLLVLLVVAGVGASAFQNLPQFVGERIRPQASRISISKGWKRLFGVQGFAEFLKSLGKLGFAVAVLTFVLSDSLRQFLSGMLTQTTDFALVIRGMAIDISDLDRRRDGPDRRRSTSSGRASTGARTCRMTKQEVKDELKQSEGDPIVKSRLRSLARDRARRRMMTAVPRATLVIANPTHYSIALKYVREEDSAPIVLAKGQDLVALKIREIAEANNIPVFEDVALARSMYKQVSVDSVIPQQFYQAVAELIRVVYANKAKRKVQ